MQELQFSSNLQGAGLLGFEVRIVERRTDGLQGLSIVDAAVGESLAGPVRTGIGTRIGQRGPEFSEGKEGRVDLEGVTEDESSA